MGDAPDLSADTAPCTIYHGSAVTPSSFGQSPADAARWRLADELFARRGGTEAAVLIADASIVQQTSAVRGIPSHVVIIAADVAAETALGRRAHFSVAEFRDASSRGRVIRAACHLSCTRLTAKRRRRQLARTNRELRELSQIGLALMEERDPPTLLRRILTMGKELTDSDGAAILLVEAREGAPPVLRLAEQEFSTLPHLEKPDITLPIDGMSIIGHAAEIKAPVVIDDAYELPADADYTRNAEFDARYGYRLRSMLIVPMLDHHGRLVGVLLLVNRVSDPAARIIDAATADRWVLPYTGRELRLARSLAGQAAVSIENAQLHAQIERILASFVKAAVTAIDDRDPTTSGHSVRVAELTVNLAKAVERDGHGSFHGTHFTAPQMRELRFAALLHDFGKLSIHEDVLVKAKKLPPLLWERVNARFDLIRRTTEVEYYRKRIRLAAEDHAAIARLDAALAAEVAQLEQFRTVVREANEPQMTAGHSVEALRAIAQRTFEACDGATIPFLTTDELHFLELAQGTLDDRERAEIESHVEETFRFLDQIPWTDDLKNLASYAYGHHEKLNGSGYPRRLSGDAIPLQTRMITLADIFDALTAADRPYKPAVPADRALEIIQSDANAGLLDQDLVRVLVDSRAYRKILEEDWRGF